MSFTRGIKDGIPICLGYFAVSIAFGILAVNQGLTVIEAVLISLTNLTSAGQFAGLRIIASLGTYMELALSQLIINMRYVLMAISLSQKVDESCHGIWRWILGFGITDEIYAVAVSHDSISRAYFGGLMITPILGWTGGTFVGAVLGNVLPEAISKALGLALYGMFIAIVIPDARDSKPVRIAALMAVAVSMLLYYMPAFSGISEGFKIILCTVIASAAAAIFFPTEVDES